MKKRLFALLVATLVVLSVAIPIGAEESTTYRLAHEGTIIAIPTASIYESIDVPNVYVAGVNAVKWRIPCYDGAEIKRIETTTDGNVEQIIGKLVATGTTDDTYTYFELINVNTAVEITVSDTKINSGYSQNKRFIILQVIVPIGAEPEVTDPEPEVTDPEPEVTDPEPEVTDPEPEETADGLTEATANTLRFWEEFFNKIIQYIAHPSYALYDINSPVFTVLVLVFAGVFLLLVLDFIKQFFTNFRR